MNIQQRSTLDTFNKAVTFVDTNPPILANAPPGFATQVQALRAAIARIEAVAPDRGSGKPAKTANQRALLRHNLRVAQLYPIRRVAKVLERNVVGMPHLVNIPARTSSTQSLLDAAKAAARDVAPYKDQFIEKGMATDFLDQLNTAIQALENVSTANMTARMAAASAKGELEKAFKDGRDALTLMDGVIRKLCDADPANGAGALAIWNTIVSPRGVASRTASNAASGTSADVNSGVVTTSATGGTTAGESGTTDTGGSDATSGAGAGSTASVTAPAASA